LALTNYRFLPYSRRGLVAQVENPDTLAALPAGRGSIRVAVAVNGGAPVSGPSVGTYGPGDIIGIDTRVIVRTEPRPVTPDFEANFLAAIDFDAPDFPWMLTPAAANVAGGVHRLRPWLVLLVFDRELVEPPRLAAGKPLPVVEIPAELTATELPDLSESWAWAHAQVTVARDFSGALPAEMASRPDLNVSRLLCPRRLAPARRYLACLVPAFDQGVTRGLGGTPDPKLPLGPAWASAPAGAVRLPVYFHWEFSTGAGGDFEELARKLKPIRPLANLGYQKVYLHPEELEVAGLGPTTSENYTWIEGALQAPRPTGSPPPAAGEPAAALSTIPQAIRDRIVQRLDEPAAIAAGHPTNAAQPLGPPVYGGFPVNQHVVASTPHLWLEELNVDARARVAAGLGAEVVRRNQEDFMQACWEQVDEVLKANELLNRARFAEEIGLRVVRRFFGALSPELLTSVLAPMLARVPFGASTAAMALGASSLPRDAFDPALRRLTSPMRPAVRAALRRGRRREPGAALGMIATLNAPSSASDPTAFVPDGLEGSRALERAAREGSALDFRPAGFAATLAAAPAAALRESAAAAQRFGTRGFTPLALGDAIERNGVVIGTALRSARVRAARPPLRDVITRPPVRDPGVIARYKEAFASYVATAGVAKAPPVTRFEVAAFASLRATLVVRTDPVSAIRARVGSMLSLNQAPLVAGANAAVMTSPQYDRILVAPRIDDATYRYLADYDAERFLPGAGQIPVDSVVLLVTNPRFVESFLVGLNHEMNRELLWRGYPTDQRGTVFRRFWAWADGGDDIPDVHTWPATSALGGTARQPAGGGQEVVMLVRGQLLRRYPGTVVLAWKGEQRDGRLQLKANPATGDVLAPVFSGRFAPDFTFFGFPLTTDDIATGNWFLVLQEQPTEPRFGFDTPESDQSAAPASWLDATWSDVGTAEGGYLRLAGHTLAGHTLGGATFGRDAAHMAAVLLQRPFRAAILAQPLLERLEP
jgi:hypothetical protein